MTERPDVISIDWGRASVSEHDRHAERLFQLQHRIGLVGSMAASHHNEDITGEYVLIFTEQDAAEFRECTDDVVDILDEQCRAECGIAPDHWLFRTVLPTKVLARPIGVEPRKWWER